MELTVKQQEARASIQNLEDSLTRMWTEENDIFIGDSDFCPLKHHFTDGLYGREIFLKKDTIAIGKLHKKDSFVFIMSGEAKIVTENGTDAPAKIIDTIEFHAESCKDSVCTYSHKIKPNQPGSFNYSFRLFPKNENLAHRQDFKYIRWI